MLVTGYFPYVPEDWSGWGNKTAYHHPSHKYKGALSSEELRSFYLQRVKSAVARDSNIYSGVRDPSLLQTHFGPFQCTITGTPVASPPDKFITTRVKMSHADFQKRKRNGEIMMGNYAVASAWLAYRNGLVDAVPPKNGVNMPKFDTQCMLFEKEVIPSLGTHLRFNNLDISSGSFSLPTRKRTVDVSLTPYDVGWNDKIIEDWLHRIPFSPNHGMITECASDANRGLIDALTAIAEMPETIRSIMDGCKAILRLYRDAKNREFRLYDKLKRLRSLSRSENDARNNAKAIKDITDAIASVWLNFRYNITPTAIMIEELIRASESRGLEFLRFRKFVMTDTLHGLDDLLPPGWTASKDSIGTAHRACIKRSFGVTPFGFEHLVSANVAVTIWELVPFSFIVDWVLNIGNYLSSLISPSVNYSEGATISWKIEDSITFTHTSNAMVDVRIAAYRRIKINPSDYCRLVWDPDINIYRQLDAFALSWKMLTGDLSKTYR